MRENGLAANAKDLQPGPSVHGPGAHAASPGDVRRAAQLFKVLSHPDRLRLACRLGDGKVTTQSRLVEEFGWPQSTMARHLAALRQAGLVTGERDGPEIRLRMGALVGLELMDTVCSWLHDEVVDEEEGPSPSS